MSEITHMIKYKRKYASLGLKSNEIMLPEGVIILSVSRGVKQVKLGDDSITEPCIIITYLVPES